MEGINTGLKNSILYRKFVIPALIIQLFSGILQLADRIIGALFIGEEILAVVTLMFPILMFGISISVMIMVGLGTEINYLLGRNNLKKANGIANFTVIISSIISITLCILGVLFNSQIVDLVVQEESLKSLASEYLNYILFTFPSLSIGYTLSTIIIADSSPKYNMFGQFILSIGNVILNVVFIIIFKMGIAGLGLATLISSTLFLLYNLSYFLLRLNKTLKITKPIIDFKELFKIMYNGLSEFITIGANGFTMIVLNYVIVKYIGLNFFIAYSTFNLLSALYINIRYGGINGVSPIISKLLGEKNIDKAIELTKYTFVITAVVSLIIYILSYFMIIPVSRTFITDVEILEHTKNIYLTYGAVYMLGIIADFAGGFLTAIKKPLHSIATNALKPIIMIPIIVSGSIILLGERGLFIGIIIVEVIYIPFVYIFMKNILRKLKI